MKIINLSKKIAILFLCITIGAPIYSQQQPENASFELWEDVGLNIDEPIDWSSIKTSDAGALVNGFAPYVWDKSTDAHTGNFSVKLYSGTVLGIVAPGMVTNGRAHAEISGVGWVYTNTGDERWRTACTSKPDSVVIWAKFSPVGGDIGQVKAVLHTGNALIPDAAMVNYVAVADIAIPDATPTWTRFSAPFNYLNGNTPQYILFVVSSADDLAHLGTEAYFDDIELIYNDVELDLTVYLEGAYNADGQMINALTPDYISHTQPYSGAPWNYPGLESFLALPSTDIVDWVLVEIRDAASAASATSATAVGRKAGFLLKDGSIVGMDGISRLTFPVYINQNLYTVVWHRNHLPIMSNLPLVRTSGIYYYDYSTSATQNYGGANGCVQLNTSGPNVWGMIGGNGDANNTINNADKTNFWSVLVGKSGYLSGDYNLDGNINNQDKNDVWLNNLSKSSSIPN